MYDVIIIGKGPAGLSASLYTGRGNLKTLIIGKESEALKNAYIENYCCSEPEKGEKLIEKGIKQALEVGVEIKDEEVIGIKKDETFTVTTTEGQYEGKAVVIATGKPRVKVKIDNIEKFEGKGVHYCVACDGFFYQGAKVGILGFKDYAFHETMEMATITDNITIYTNGNNLEMKDENIQILKEKGYKINYKKIKSLEGENLLKKIIFEDGTEEDIDGLFIAYGSASSIDFARKLGVVIKNNSIEVDENQKTNIDGLFAAGDCTGGIMQVATAVGQGAVAGLNAKAYVQKNF